MSRDYKSRKSSKSSNTKSGSAFFGGFVGYALGLISAIGIWLYLNYAPSPFLSAEKVAGTEKSASRSATESAKTSPKQMQEEKLVEEKPRFDFYKILPGIDEPEMGRSQTNEPPVQSPLPKIPEISTKPAEIVRQPAATYPTLSAVDIASPALIQPRSIPPVEAMQQPATPAAKNAIKSTEKYFLQAGAFRKNDDAENLKARLALLGVFAFVQSIDLAEKGTWYRVRVGPFTKKEEVDQTSASLRENGIATQFIKIQ
jgi:cell division protein FtsN